jgi:hypothetical protein
MKRKMRGILKGSGACSLRVGGGKLGTLKILIYGFN